SRTSRGSRTAANPLINVWSSVAVAHDLTGPDAYGVEGPGVDPEPDPDTDEDEREEGTRVSFRRDDQHEEPRCVPDRPAAELSSFRVPALDHVWQHVVHWARDTPIRRPLPRDCGNLVPGLGSRLPEAVRE